MSNSQDDDNTAAGQQAPILRDRPYIWVTWISKLLVGSDSCEWAAWFKAQHLGSSWQKADSDFNLVIWNMKHNAMLNRVTDQLELASVSYRIENQNHFSLRIGDTTLGGKPDIVSLPPGQTPVVLDCKTGQQRPEHMAQVMLYMWALPLAIPSYSGLSFDGRLIYQENVVHIPASAVDSAFIELTKNLIEKLASQLEPRRVPSYFECRFCPITSSNCPDRMVDC